MLKPKYFLYARKSTEDDDHPIMSIEAQLFELRQYARRENLEILEEFTESKSAKKPGREKFNEMMSLVENSEGVGILAWHPDRLARNSVDGGKVIYLVDTTKIVSLRFLTFWFEPTPQGLFMLQVAFGQSKYYSDNLVENINRGFRQKIRRGEWLTKAPFGYLNNFKTRTIEPHPFHSKVVKRAFEEFATGKYTYESLADFLAELGVETKNRTPLGKASIWRMLSNRAYLGLTKHKGEYFEGSFQPILSPAIFEAVQIVLKRKAKPRKSKELHNFPFRGLLTCGECKCAITGQNAVGKSGGFYRYYRCTKKRGACSQKFIQESVLADQLKARLSKITICDEDTGKMLKQVEIWENEQTSSSQMFVQNSKQQIQQVQDKLDKLVNAYIDGDIPKENYLTKKEELLKQKVQLAQDLENFGRTGKNWLKPLRAWILETKKAAIAANSKNLIEIKEAVQTVGSNPKLFNKNVVLEFAPLWQKVAEILQKSGATPTCRGGGALQETSKNLQSSLWWRCRELNPGPKLINFSIVHKISQLKYFDATN